MPASAEPSTASVAGSGAAVQMLTALVGWQVWDRNEDGPRSIRAAVEGVTVAIELALNVNGRG